MRSIYIATRITNIDVYNQALQAVQEFNFEVTYNWTTHGLIQPEKKKEMYKVGMREIAGVRKADIVLAITPMGNGTHFELGVAHTLQIPIVVWENVPVPEYKSFYFLDRIHFCNSLDFASRLCRDLANTL